MARYFFNAHYRGSTVIDDVGEEFTTTREAEAHAAIISRELSRNDSPLVTVFVHNEGGVLIASKVGAAE
jgi:hypothetical protein